MAVIGYKEAKRLMEQQGWKARVTMRNGVLQAAELFLPDCPTVHTIRRDSAKRLIPECYVYGRGTNDDIAILCYDHNRSNEDLV